MSGLGTTCKIPIRILSSAATMLSKVGTSGSAAVWLGIRGFAAEQCRTIAEAGALAGTTGAAAVSALSNMEKRPTSYFDNATFDRFKKAVVR